MSKKSKLILATAVFGAALFAASCGGGGGSTAGTEVVVEAVEVVEVGGGGGNQPPPATEEGKVLALLDVGGAGAGTVNPVTICKLKSDNKAYCENDLNPSASVDLEYLYEFPLPNGNVVLKAGNVLYFFDGSQVIKPDKYRALGATSDTSAPGGITLPSSPTYYATDNFVILVDNTGSPKQLVVITSSGKVIKDSDSTGFSVNASCETVEKRSTSTTYKLNTDGTSSSTTLPTPIKTITSVSGKYLVKDSSNKVYLSDSTCSASGVLVDTISGNINEAYMVKVIDSNNNPHFFIAIRTPANSDRDVKYYRVSGDTATTLNTITLNTGPNPYYYALDGKGRLYAITNISGGNTTVNVYNTDGTQIGSGLTISSVTLAGLLGLADRVLAKDSSKAYEITTTGSTVNAADKGTVLYEPVNKCTDGSNIIDTNGVGTNFIRCAHNSGLYSLTYDSGSGLYSKAIESISNISNVKWATGKVLVKPSSGSIKLCSTTTTPSISCSDTDLPDFDTTNINTDKYLKFNGNNVFYAKDAAGNTVNPPKVGNVFDPPSALPITVSSPSGGNASLDLNKFAFSFKPSGATCNTQIAYLSSRTASPKTYTITQPSGACVKRILKVY
jgi:hypothetical protein